MKNQDNLDVERPSISESLSCRDSNRNSNEDFIANESKRDSNEEFIQQSRRSSEDTNAQVSNPNSSDDFIASDRQTNQVSVLTTVALCFSRFAIGLLIGSYEMIIMEKLSLMLPIDLVEQYYGIGRSVYFTSSTLSSILVGWIMDRSNIKVMYVKWAGLFGVASTILVYQTENISGTLAAMSLLGLANGISYIAVTDILMSDTTMSRRGNVMGWIEGSCALGLFIGPMLAGLLVEYVSLSTTLFAFVLIMALNGGISLLLEEIPVKLAPEPIEDIGSLMEVFMKHQIVYSLLLAGVVGGIFTVFDTQLVFYFTNTMRMSSGLTGTINSVYSLVNTLISPIVGVLSDKFPKYHFLVFATVLGLGATLTLALTTNLPLAIVMVVLVGVAIPTFEVPLIPYVLQLETDARFTGRITSLCYNFMAIGGIIATVVISVIPDFKIDIIIFGGALFALQVIYYIFKVFRKN
ncbi:hypothetical protein HDV06_005727 [Boothiomyces sp. JEL0866]|nr:hypothetical protein HDV06_005727 [Boothiomyces sp. JEL0866]